ncbi:MAG: YggS family pyridoxal phosphate-dependent enzyme [Alphaproteobacteria bacterium]|nr:YggS family pyridoxal phosphate-dependent enzyme [Alphaproteobacteria bacterium]
MTISSALAEIQSNIARAAGDDGRLSSDVTLIAVSKKQPDDRIDAALQAGLRIFGENRVQEAQSRWQHRRATHKDLTLHLIGPLQTNKAADAVALFDVIETVDREKLAASLAKEMQKQGRQLDCFVQVNTGDEDQKAGITPDQAVEFVGTCRATYGLNVTGLMCIPPVDEEPAMHFALLKTLAAAAGVSKLSMGMSGDYDTAIRFGATHVRVGSSLFGARPVEA